MYNLGGGRQNSVSILEAVSLIEQATNFRVQYTYSEKNRMGDHICYISDLGRLRNHFPGWNITIGLSEIIEEMVEAEFSSPS